MSAQVQPILGLRYFGVERGRNGMGKRFSVIRVEHADHVCSSQSGVIDVESHTTVTIDLGHGRTQGLTGK